MSKTSRSAQAPAWKASTTFYSEGPASVLQLPVHSSHRYLTDLLDRLVHAETTFLAESQLGHYLQGGLPGCKRCGLLALQVQALAVSLASLGTEVTNWSLDPNAQERGSVADMVLSYVKPLVHMDLSIQRLAEDLKRLPGTGRAAAQLSEDAAQQKAPSPEQRLVHASAEQRGGYSVMPSLATSAPGKLTRISDFSSVTQPRTHYGAAPRIAVEVGSWTGRKFLFENPTYRAWEVKEESSEEEAVPEPLSPESVDPIIMPPPPMRRLRIVIVGAKNLADADFGLVDGESDPYCICKVPAKPQLEFKTNTINNTANPVWDYEGHMAEWAVGDDLRFDVFDKDNLSSDPLGGCTLDSRQFHHAGFAGEIALEGVGAREDSKLRVEIYLPCWVKLTVLKGMNFSGQDADSYFKMHISGKVGGKGKPRGETKSPSVKSSNPEWRLPVILKEFFHGEQLEFEVWHAKQDLGKTAIQVRDIHEGMAEGDEPGICVFDLPLLLAQGRQAAGPRPALRVAFAMPLPHKLTILSVRGMRNQTPYVNVSVAGRAFKQGKKGWEDSPIACFKTPHVKDVQGEAALRASGVMDEFYYGERIVFEIYNSQWGSDAMLGRCELACEDIREALVDGTSEHSVAIEATSKVSGRASLLARVALPLPLRVKIIGAHNLNSKGGSDAYVLVQKASDGHETEAFRTKVVKSTNPVWDETHYLPAFFLDEALKFVVYDSNLGRDGILGKATVYAQQLKNGPFVGKLILTETGVREEAALNVDIFPCVPIPLPADDREDEGQFFFQARTQQTFREVSVQTAKPKPFEQLGAFTGEYMVKWTPPLEEDEEGDSP